MLQAAKNAIRRVPFIDSIARVARKATYSLSPLNWDATESVLLRVLRRRMLNRIYHDWYHSGDPPHFGYHNYDALMLAYFDQQAGPFSFARAFFSALLVREGDRVLDIGCGDGFFAKRFLAVKAAHVDAIDIDERALAFARRYNLDPKVTFYLQDAVTGPFPRTTYDVVVWDGAIGHFSAATTEAMIRKIKTHLRPGGIFSGSEELGKVANEDHLQYWESLDEVKRMLSPHFRAVEVFSLTYHYDIQRTAKRTEFFWRASDDPGAFAAAKFLA